MNVLGNILGKKIKKDIYSHNINQKKYGTKVEMEHVPTFEFIKGYLKEHKRLPPDKMIASKIASNHLEEDKLYYSKLKKAKL
jgi:hypothetical protein